MGTWAHGLWIAAFYIAHSYQSMASYQTFHFVSHMHITYMVAAVPRIITSTRTYEPFGALNMISTHENDGTQTSSSLTRPSILRS